VGEQTLRVSVRLDDFNRRSRVGCGSLRGGYALGGLCHKSKGFCKVSNGRLCKTSSSARHHETFYVKKKFPSQSVRAHRSIREGGFFNLRVLGSVLACTAAVGLALTALAYEPAASLPVRLATR